MNLLAVLSVFIFVTLTHGRPQPPLEYPGAPTTELRPPPCMKEGCGPEYEAERAKTKWWEALQKAIKTLKNGGNMPETYWEEAPKEKPPVHTTNARALSFGVEPPSSVGARALTVGGAAAPVPMMGARLSILNQADVKVGDIGVCSTQVGTALHITSGKLYRKPGRTVFLTHPIAPKDVKCRSDIPPTGGAGDKCVLVGYPHGAWVRVGTEFIGEYNSSSCYAVNGSTDKQCFDYVIVPGQCVLQRTNL